MQKILIATLLLVFPMEGFSRLVRSWSYQELMLESDAVAIVEPVENKPAGDHLTIPGHNSADYSGIDTKFKVHVILKGKHLEELTVLHFNYSKNPGVIVNGAGFIDFGMGGAEFETRITKDGKSTVVSSSGHVPQWIAFLKRRSDGRFEPVTGQYDADGSFREVHHPLLFTK